MYDRKKLNELKDSLEKWEETSLQKTFASMPERQDAFLTTSSEPVERLYTPLDIEALEYEKDLGLPGEYPYTRGVHPTLHRGKLWTMRMFAGFGTAEETSARFKYLLEQGQTGLSIAFDLPTLMGYDSDHEAATRVTPTSAPRQLYHVYVLAPKREASASVSIGTSPDGAIRFSLGPFTVEEDVQPAGLAGGAVRRHVQPRLGQQPGVGGTGYRHLDEIAGGAAPRRETPLQGGQHCTRGVVVTGVEIR